VVDLPETGFVRLPQILGDRKRGTPGIIPISAASWWRGVKAGRYPASVKLGPRSVGWRVEDIRALVAEIGAPR
jgi:prophage regulatory protein